MSRTDRANTSKSLFNRNDSVYSSSSTHQGGSLHIAGFGEAHNFKYNDDSMRSRFNGSLNDNNYFMNSSGNNFNYKTSLDDSNSRSMSQSQLDLSHDSNGNPLTDEQRESRIKQKMRKKHEKKKKMQKQMKQARKKNGGITNPDQ